MNVSWIRRMKGKRGLGRLYYYFFFLFVFRKAVVSCFDVCEFIFLVSWSGFSSFPFPSPFCFCFCGLFSHMSYYCFYIMLC